MRLYAVFYANSYEGAVALVRASRADAAKLAALRENFFPPYVGMRSLHTKVVPEGRRFFGVMTCGK